MKIGFEHDYLVVSGRWSLRTTFSVVVPLSISNIGLSIAVRISWDYH